MTSFREQQVLMSEVNVHSSDQSIVLSSQGNTIEAEADIEML